MNPYNETIQTWNKIAQLYQEKFMDLTLYNESYDFFCSQFVQAQPNILEIGCGPGNITRYILSVRPDFKILGTDAAPAMIELAQKNIPNAGFRVLDARHIDELNSKYDGIVCGFCLPYLSEMDCIKLIKDCSNLLLSGGVLYLSFVEGDASKSGYMTGSSGDRTYFYYHDLQLLESHLNESGFGILNIFKIKYDISETKSEVHTVVVVKKN